jgi:hypothetical protein
MHPARGLEPGDSDISGNEKRFEVARNVATIGRAGIEETSQNVEVGNVMVAREEPHGRASEKGLCTFELLPRTHLGKVAAGDYEVRRLAFDLGGKTTASWA